MDETKPESFPIDITQLENWMLLALVKKAYNDPNAGVLYNNPNLLKTMEKFENSEWSKYPHLQ